MTTGKMTIEHLAQKVDKLTESVAVIADGQKALSKSVEELSSTVDDLAIITKKGFDQVDRRFNVLEREISEVKLRQDNSAYRFEMKHLDKRVTILEKKAKLC